MGELIYLLGLNRAPARRRPEPRSHVDGPFIMRARIFDWFQDDPEMAVEDDATPAHGIERVDVAGWIRSELG